MQRPDDLLADPATALLDAAFADAWRDERPSATVVQRLRERLAARAAASGRAEQGMVTVRAQRPGAEALAPGVRQRVLYRAGAAGSAGLRPGEPLQVSLVEIAPGTRWTPAPAAPGVQRDWLVMQGAVMIGTATLAERDYHVVPAGQSNGALDSERGALLYLREAALAARPGEVVRSIHDAEAGWQDYAPRIQRRVLWQRDGEAAMLYLTEPGAEVPQHRHGHDEECLMVAGEVFLDDLLLCEGDWQLAPAGTGHRLVSTDTGVVIYAHGDIDLDFV